MTTTVKKRIAWSILICAVVGTVVWLIVSAHLSATTLSVAKYDIPCDVTKPLCIVQLSDLHSLSYGENNAELIARVAEQSPDLIFMTGDMLNRGGAPADLPPLCGLIQALTKIAPVYWADGNHERQFVSSTGVDLHAEIAKAGAVVLDGSYADVTVCGQELRIGGYYGYYGVPHMTTDDAEVEAAEKAFFADFENTERLKVLLCHIPTGWVDWNYIDTYPVDLIFSGHYHGGQVRLPLIGGLYAPYVGLFPGRARGVYEGQEGTCILSAGLGTEPGIPRINNLPELVVAELQPRETE